MTFGNPPAQLSKAQPALVDGLDQDRLATFPPPCSQHGAPQCPVEQPPFVEPDLTSGLGHGYLAFCGPPPTSDFWRVVFVGVSHAVDEG